MEDEDYRIMVLNDTTMKVFRDGRIHTFRKDHNVWYQRKLTENKDGYQMINIGWKPRKPYKVHRIMALCYLGERPVGHQIDHINSIRADNRLENLQYLTLIDNNHKKNTMNGQQIRGYHQRENGRFRALIGHNGKHISLGTYDTEDEARQAYVDAKLKYHKNEIKQ